MSHRPDTREFIEACLITAVVVALLVGPAMLASVLPLWAAIPLMVSTVVAVFYGLVTFVSWWADKR